MALVALSVVEQRLDAVRAVLAGATVTAVAAQIGVSRQSLHTWVGWYLTDGVAGLADRPPGTEVVSALRRHGGGSGGHRVAPGASALGANRTRTELLRKPVPAPGPRPGSVVVPSVSTINRILAVWVSPRLGGRRCASPRPR